MAQGLFNLKQVNQAVQQGAWTTGLKPASVDYLVVAGGGNGGDLVGGGNGAGAGGAGGVLTGSVPVVAGTSYTVTVGAGLGRFGEGTGGSSVFGSISTTGGGSGARANNNAGRAGGSGGGGSGPTVYANGYQGTFNQGNRGGNSPADTAAGGGGGAGSRGINGFSTSAGNGGVGVASDISGTRTTYAGGGGGGGGNAGVGGQGGGGSAGVAGTANTGGGGGGSIGFGDGYAGGSGIVIVSYPDIYAAAASTTGSPTVSTSGSGSIYFSSSDLVYANNTVFDLGSGDFTVELWAYLTGSSGSLIDYSNGDASNSNHAWEIYQGAATTVTGSIFSSTTAYNAGSTSVTQNTWNHLALVRNGNTMYFYVNGVQANTALVTGVTSNNPASSTLKVGGYGSKRITGYLSNVRVVKGTAVYTAAFTVPTAPLRAVSGTSILLSSVSGAYTADSSANAFYPASSTGPAVWNTLSPFSVTGYKNRVYKWTSSGSITF